MEEERKIELQLISSVLDQAELFLNDAGEFYPFATAIDQERRVIPMSVFLNDDIPNTIEMVSKLEEVIKDSIQHQQYKCAAIGLDVRITETQYDQQVYFDAVQIRLIQNGNWYVHNFIYSNDSGKFIIERNI